MLMKPEPLCAAIDSVRTGESETIYLSPDGEPFTHELAVELSTKKHLVLVSGHYEGIDQRAEFVHQAGQPGLQALPVLFALFVGHVDAERLEQAQRAEAEHGEGDPRVRQHRSQRDTAQCRVSSRSICTSTESATVIPVVQH